jgi:hypothetical protein
MHIAYSAYSAYCAYSVQDKSLEVFIPLYTTMCMYILITVNHVHTDFNPITTGFCGTHQDAELCDFTEPSKNKEEHWSSPCPGDGDVFTIQLGDKVNTVQAIPNSMP